MHGTLEGVRVLMVDDQPETVEPLEMYLRQQGAQVRLITAPVEAMKELGDFQPDIIVSDLSMPIVDGFNLMAMIRMLRAGRATPALALSAHYGRTGQDRALEAGFDEFLSKPAAPPLVAEAIRRLLGRT